MIMWPGVFPPPGPKNPETSSPCFAFYLHTLVHSRKKCTEHYLSFITSEHLSSKVLYNCFLSYLKLYQSLFTVQYKVSPKNMSSDINK
jgi:hypothetical protein